MTVQQWITLIVAICGVLHGPLIPLIARRISGNRSGQ